MNEEEKEAIKVLNHFDVLDCGIQDRLAIETILELIEKQQKEIERLKNLKNTIKMKKWYGKEKITLVKIK